MDPAEICASDLTQQVMVIQLPRGDRAESDLSAYRDYVVESLAQGVLVLGSGTTWVVETVPSLGGVQIQREPGILRAHSVPEPKADPKPDRPNPWREKKERRLGTTYQAPVDRYIIGVPGWAAWMRE